MDEQRLTPEDQARISALFDDQYDLLRRLASRLPRGTGEGVTPGRELVMEAFEAAIEKWEEIGSWETESQLKWLWVVCWRRRIDELRRQGRLRALVPRVAALSQTQAASTEEIVLARLALEEVAAVINGMPEMRRAVAARALLLHMPPNEIADVLKMKQGTVRVHIAHARKQLREEAGVHLPFPLKGSTNAPDGEDDGEAAERRRA
ncbi:RNA polymerase sigma factor [Streptomyces sp. LARHCF249]